MRRTSKVHRRKEENMQRAETLRIKLCLSKVLLFITASAKDLSLTQPLSPVNICIQMQHQDMLSSASTKNISSGKTLLPTTEFSMFLLSCHL
ncbi:hypothetical protein AVEN_168830-1, partial [Araneus ventricosus]